jgi:hypothetical protein
LTLLAGCLSKRSDMAVPPAIAAHLAEGLDRTGGHALERRELGPALLVSVDIGAFEDRPLIARPDMLATLTGHPHLAAGDGSRTSACQHLCEALGSGTLPTLCREAKGSFSFCHVDRAGGMLTLVTDPLGLRPLYLYEDDQVVLFSTVFRLLQTLPGLALSPDREGIEQTATFGFTLGDRTTAAEIETVPAGAILQLDRLRRQVRTYVYWSELTASGGGAARDEAAVHAAFLDAVRRRVRRADRPQCAMLSGGLDSRCIVSLLRAEGHEVQTFNASRAKTLDVKLAADFARAAGARHVEIENTLANGVHVVGQIADHLRATQGSDGARAIWSGDGGSVGAGAVYLDEALCRAFETGPLPEAIEAFLRFNRLGIPTGVLQPGYGREANERLLMALETEIRKASKVVTAKSAYVFLLRNDQRKHLWRYWEDIDRIGMEMLLPFLDFSLVKLLCRLNVRDLLYHDFYDRWLHHFPKVTTAVPWQTYPGHRPCWLPLPADHADQWRAKSALAARIQREEARGALSADLRRHLPAGALSTPKLLLRALLTRIGNRSALASLRWLYRLEQGYAGFGR